MSASAPRPLRVGIAVRRSKKSVGAFEQYGVEASPERQAHDCKDWVERNCPGPVVFVFFEEDGYSAWEVKGQPRRKRPEFEREITTIEGDRLDIMVHWKVDRAARGYENGQRLWRACQRTDTRLVFVNDGLDSEHPMFEQMYFWMLGIAKEYSNRISAGLTQYREALKRAGVRAPTRRRFGWAPDGLTPLEAEGELTWKVRRTPPEGGSPVLVEVTFEPEAKHLREAGEQFVADKPHLPRAEQHSIQRIINDWNARGIVSPYGRPWTHSTFHEVFRAPYNELIFGPELYWEIQRVLDDPERRTNHRGSERVHVLTGRILHDDPVCGKKLKGAFGRKRRATGRAVYTNCGCGKIHEQTWKVDGLHLDDLMYRLDCRAVERGLARASADGEYRDLPSEWQRAKARYDELEGELAKLQDAEDYATDREKQAETRVKLRAMANLDAKMDDIDHLIREQEDQLHDDQLVEEALRLGPALRAAWETMTPQQRRDLLEAAGWERTNVRTGKPKTKTLDPWRVKRHWRNKRDGELVVEVGPSKGALPPPTCSVVDDDGACEKPVTTRAKRHGWCMMHLRRWQRTGDPTKKRPWRGRTAQPRGICVIDDPPCDKPVRVLSRGWCNGHYARWRRTGDPSARSGTP